MRVKDFWIAAMILGLLGVAGPAIAVPLSNWNVTELNASGDYVNVTIGSHNGNTTLTVQWVAGPGNVWSAIGIDQFLYNCTSCGPFTGQHDDESGDPGAIMQIWLGSIGTGTDVTSSWAPHFDGGRGDGFGAFSSLRNTNSGGTQGISQPLIFVLNGLTSFTVNDTTHNATFAAHVRYQNDCSGWASDGSAGSSVGSDSNCAAVPEPAALLLMTVGWVGFGFMNRRLRAS